MQWTGKCEGEGPGGFGRGRSLIPVSRDYPGEMWPPSIPLPYVERVQCRALSSCCHRSLGASKCSVGRCEGAHIGSCLSYLSMTPGDTRCAQPSLRSRFGQTQKEEGILGVSIQVPGSWEALLCPVLWLPDVMGLSCSLWYRGRQLCLLQARGMALDQVNAKVDT